VTHWVILTRLETEALLRCVGDHPDAAFLRSFPRGAVVDVTAGARPTVGGAALAVEAARRLYDHAMIHGVMHTTGTRAAMARVWRKLADAEQRAS
jgi:hypothetical protein